MSIRAAPTFYAPTGFQKLTVSSTAVGFTLPSSPTTRAVILFVETDQVRFRVDGSDPDSTTGCLLNAGDVVEFTNPQMIQQFKAIRVTTDATLQIHYFGGNY